MKIVIIGLGSMGKRRIRLIQGLCPEYQIVGIDSKQERIREASEIYKIKCFQSIKEVKEAMQIQCAFVCTSPLSHAAIIKECLLNDWHVFTEINLVSDGYEENMHLADEKKLTLFLSSTPIYRTEMKKITDTLKENAKQVNYIYHVGQYLPDWHPWENFQQFFVQDKRTNGCRELFAIELPWMMKAFGSITKIQVIAGKITNLNIAYKDHYLLLIQHENGTNGVLAVDVVCREAVRRLEIYNEDLYIEWNGTPESLRYKNLITNKMELMADNSEYKNESGYHEFVNEYAYVNEIKEFFEVVMQEKKVQYGFEDDMHILALIDTIEKD